MTPKQRESLIVTYLLLTVVVVVGIVNFAAGIFIEGYKPDFLITTLFAGVLGARLGVQSIVYRRRNRGDEEDE